MSYRPRSSAELSQFLAIGLEKDFVVVTFGFRHNLLRISRHQALASAIHHEVEFFQDDCTDQNRLSSRLDDGAEDAFAPGVREVYVPDDVAIRSATVREADFGGPG